MNGSLNFGVKSVRGPQKSAWMTAMTNSEEKKSCCVSAVRVNIRVEGRVRVSVRVTVRVTVRVRAKGKGERGMESC